MNPDSLCMGCMADTNAAEVCPYCGYVNHSPAESSVQLVPRTMLAGKYVLGRVLGQGGFGITYLAYDLEKDRKLAIKEYFPAVISTRAHDRLTVTPLATKNRPDLDYGLNKFYEEGQALYRFREHANVVTMVELFRANGTGYIVMLYIEGHTFKEHLIRKGGKIPFLEALASLRQVMSALEDLHAAGILHRDISPDNIYLEDGGGVRILDFGATRYAMGEQSRSLSVVLKPGYAPEEQYRSRGKQGPWTDIYALGATFYRAIAGQVPAESVDRVQLDDLVPPSRLGADIPPHSEIALLKALAVRAENRFQSVATFRNAVTPPVAPPVSSRAPKAAFLTVFAVLALVILVAASMPGLFGLLLIAQLSFFGATLALCFNLWKPIQDGQARTSPEKAAGLLLVPVFNLFWIFAAVGGFAKDFNRFVERHSLAAKPLSEPLFLCCSLIWAVYWLIALFFRGLPTMGALILLCFVLFPVVITACNGIDALKSAGVRKAEPLIEPPKRISVPAATNIALHCSLGEYQGQDIEIGNREIVVGRNPSLANLVLTSGEVSSKHVRIWRDRGSPGAWIEDLHSTNGTFYKESRSGEAGWIRLSGSKLLSIGDRFRVSNSAAEFEIKAT